MQKYKETNSSMQRLEDQDHQNRSLADIKYASLGLDGRDSIDMEHNYGSISPDQKQKTRLPPI